MGGRPYGRRRVVDHPYTPPSGTGNRRKVKLPADVDPDIHKRVHLAAQAMGITASRLVALLIERMELDPDGRPVWADEAGFPASATLDLDEDADHRLSA
jgi:hypothetical protein